MNYKEEYRVLSLGDEYRNILKQQRKYYTLAVIIVFAILTSIFRIISQVQITCIRKESDYILEVKDLSLKYILISTASEIYDINVRIKEEQGYYYKLYGDDMYNHYKWIKNTYYDMNDEMKSHLSTLFDDGSNEGNFIYTLAGINDGAGINQINYKIQSSDLPRELKVAAEKFYPYFYEKYLKEYIELNRYKYNTYLSKLNQKIQDEEPNLLGFIEEVSGIKYEKEYKPVLYYTMRPGNAWGFTYKDLYISLLPLTESEYESIFYIPYHEYSHGIFKTITSTKEFKNIVQGLKNNSTLYNAWNNNYYNHYYTWEEWCEDNLVEGFAMYLDYKANGEKANKLKSIRPYDEEYFNYLLQHKFDSKNMDLKYITIKFLEEISQE